MTPPPERPGGYSKVSEERQPNSAAPSPEASFTTAAIGEAKKTTVHISLLLIVALVAGAWWVGRSSPPPEMVSAQATQNERIAKSQAETVEQLKRMAELLDKVVQAQAAQTELARTTNTEVQFVSSYYKAGRPPAP